MQPKDHGEYEEDEARFIDVGRMFEHNMGESLTSGLPSPDKKILDKKIQHLRAYRDGKDD